MNLVIADIHGRDFWIKPCNEWDGKIIFLGDYHDPYTWQVSNKESLANLYKLVDFYNSNKDRCVFLYGNHDVSYLGGQMTYRYDTIRAKEVTALLKQLPLQLIYIEDNVIYSHAGITQGWLNHNHLTIEDVKQLRPNDNRLDQVSMYRGGYDDYSSPIWCDVNEFDISNKLSNYYQIFGHSQQEVNPIITKEYACLDVRKAFICDNTDIRQYTI